MAISLDRHFVRKGDLVLGPKLISQADKNQKGRLEWTLLAIVLVEFIELVAIPLCAIPMHVSRNYNEGWNAYFAEAAMNGGALYPSPDSMMTNNYPPLGFYIVGAVGRIIGDNIVAGRLVAVLALAVIAFNVSRLCRWLGADRRLAALAAGVCLLGTYALMPGYIGINDPQFLGYAFVTSAAVVFLNTKESHLWRGMLLSVLLMMAGGLIKHSQISLPLALCTWAIFYDRRRLGCFLVWSLIAGASAVGVLYGIWGRAMVDSIFFGVRLTSAKRAIFLLQQDLFFLLPYLALALAAFIMERSRKGASFVLIYLIWSLFNGAWMLSGSGVNQNVMEDAVIALALSSALFVMALVHTSTPAWQRVRGRALGLALMLLPCMFVCLWNYLANPSLRDVSDITDAPKWERLYKALELSHGDVACETLAVCYWAKKPMQVDFFNYGQKLFARTIYVDAPGGFYNKLNHQAYAYVVISGEARQYLPGVLFDTLFKNYKLVSVVAEKEFVFAPKQ